MESGKAEGDGVAALQKEVDEIAAIFAASHKTARINLRSAAHQITRSFNRQS
jgi:hypothetical protein